MPKKRRQAKRPVRTDRQRLESFFDQIAPALVERLTFAEAKSAQLEQELFLLKGKLVKLLSLDQLEAAEVCGCPPEVYAIKCIELWKEKIFPSFPANIRPLSALKETGGCS